MTYTNLDINYVRRIFTGRYEDITYLDRGGMSFVYKARHVQLDRIVALKILDPKLNKDWDLTNRFYQEIKIGATLNHPNILKIHYGGQLEELHFMEMDFLEGETLYHVIQRQGEITQYYAVRYIKSIVSALSHLHSHGIIHRDIKSANIFLDRKRGALLTDFGISYYKNNSASLPKNEILGTPEYMSPEQASGRRLPDERSDLYGIGVILFETLTGNVPFRGSTPIETMKQVINNPPPSPLQYQVHISEFLDRIVMRLLSKHEDNRYNSANELYYDLEEIDVNSNGKNLWKQFSDFFSSTNYNSTIPVQLKLLGNGFQNKTIPLVGKNTGNHQVSCIVGRSTHDGVIPDIDIQEPTISRQHVEIVWINGELGIRHLYSNNKTLVNGIKLDAGIIYQLNIGDKLVMGGLEFEVIR